MSLKKSLAHLLVLGIIAALMAPATASGQSDVFPSAREMMEEFSRLFEEQNKRMNELMKDFFDRSQESRFGGFPSLDSESSMPHGLQFHSGLRGFSGGDIQKIEEPGKVIFKLKGPGIDASALDVKVDRGMVNISGQVRQDQQSEGQDQFFQSTSISSFSRSFPLPHDADPLSVKIDKDDEGHIKIVFDRRRV